MVHNINYPKVGPEGETVGWGRKRKPGERSNYSRDP